MKKTHPKKILIIRFSSFGDIAQCMGVIPSLKKTFPQSEIHWFTRREYACVLRLENGIHRIWTLDSQTGLKGLIRIIHQLKQESFDFVYDAHCNLRSAVIKLFLFFSFLQKKSSLVTRKKNRFKRFLLFKLKIDLFPKPFLGIESYLRPLAKWDVPLSILPVHWTFPPVEKIDNAITKLSGKPIISLVPSCAWPMKKWPLSHWKELIRCLDEYHFLVLGGPRDTFCEELVGEAPSRIINLAGQLSLAESCAAISMSSLFVAADTGLLHAGDLIGKKGIALLGPTAFGHPSRSRTKVMETSLPCRPCTKDGRGFCSQKIYQKCLVDITPKQVAEKILEKRLLTNNSSQRVHVKV